MDRAEFKALLEPLVVALGADFDVPTWTVYYRALEDVPAPLLQAAVDRAARSCRWMPKPGELRTFAEEARQTMRAQLKFEPCPMNEGCSAQGWVTREIDGVPRMVRCACWTRHQEQVQALGAGSEVLALPRGTEDAAHDG